MERELQLARDEVLWLQATGGGGMAGRGGGGGAVESNDAGALAVMEASLQQV